MLEGVKDKLGDWRRDMKYYCMDKKKTIAIGAALFIGGFTLAILVVVVPLVLTSNANNIAAAVDDKPNGGGIGSTTTSSIGTGIGITSTSTSTSTSTTTTGGGGVIISNYTVPYSNSTRKVIYVDYQPVNWNDPGDTTKVLVDQGYNVIILAFWLYTGPADISQVWAAATNAQKQAAIDYAHSKGAIILVACGGATEDPYSYDAATYGTNVGTFAATHGFDGIDFDLENFGPGLVAPGKTAQATLDWISTANAAARSAFFGLRGVQPTICHAPQGPYFGAVGSTTSWAGVTGGYTGVEQVANVDFYNVQFYNQGASCYGDYQGLFIDSSNCAAFPGTAIMQIASYGVPLEKIVLGKPLIPTDASNGHVPSANLGAWVAQAANELNWNAGVMFWMFHGTDPSSSQTTIDTIYPKN